MIKLNGVSKFYKPDVWALNKVSLDIEPGNLFLLLGNLAQEKAHWQKFYSQKNHQQKEE